MRGIHRGPVNSPHKGPVTRKMFPFDDVIMNLSTDALTKYSYYMDIVKTGCYNNKYPGMRILGGVQMGWVEPLRTYFLVKMNSKWNSYWNIRYHIADYMNKQFNPSFMVRKLSCIVNTLLAAILTKQGYREPAAIALTYLSTAWMVITDPMKYVTPLKCGNG